MLGIVYTKGRIPEKFLRIPIILLYVQVIYFYHSFLIMLLLNISSLQWNFISLFILINF
jgi:hypothetical protein